MAILYNAVVPPADLTAFARAVPLDQQYTLNQIFPDVVDDVLEVALNAEVTSTARAAKARAFDAPPLPGKRDRFERRTVPLPAVSQFLDRGERDRLELERMRTGGTTTSAIERAIYDDTARNVQSVQLRVEMMRGDLLADGIVDIPELGPAGDPMRADFGVPTSHKVTAPVLFSDHTTPVLDQYRAWGDVYQYGDDASGTNGNGFPMGGQYMSRQVLTHLLRNEEIRGAIGGITNGEPDVGIVSLLALNGLFEAFGIPPVLGTYDARAEVDGTMTSILPSDRIVFTPPAGIRLGFTQWGMTATGLELAGANVRVEGSPAGMVAVVDKGVTPPYREAAYADATVMPVLERPRALFVAKVL